ncbi:hypothetical protein MLM_0074 [Mycobacterium lepraemurium]|nr:hypothetical protein MLM_0074 [Mycobacterium lepraemurium]
MADITMLILAGHDWFREQFARLDYLQAQAADNRDALQRVWRPLADKLDVHTYIEEKIFYPQLLKRGSADAEDETLDAIGDHNDIRDGVLAPNAAQPGTEQWLAAVGRTREANDDHMAEEERERLSDFRRTAPIGLREALGRQYAEFMAERPTTEGLPIIDRDRPATSSRSRTPRRPNRPTSRCASAASRANDRPDRAKRDANNRAPPHTARDTVAAEPQDPALAGL